MMAIIKCKMCGGDMNIDPDSTICECAYCGTKQTVPNTDDEKRLRLYERANKLRFECEFDKAEGVYESIISDYQMEAEAYWGILLCKYGIEYVDDPATGKKIPTCHRTSFDSIMDDENFELVMENADVVARGLYRDEAKQIENLRKGIIEVSSKEEPYDIFICYKETAEDGQRTIDSVIAQDVYTALVEKGYKVFFSRITLEDKLGVEYEPYIFAALNSAKVMLAFGTSYEYYNAVWVKNEWSRFLRLIESGQKKTLIPCYKDIDAYDIPKEFAKLQAQDMGKVGAIQDLLRGIDKIIRPSTPDDKITLDNNVSYSNILKRGLIALQDKDFKKATDYFDKVLDNDVENAQAYFGLFLLDNQCSTVEELIEIKKALYTDFEGNIKDACAIDEESIEKACRQYSSSRYYPEEHVREDYEYDLSYTSYVDSMESKKRDIVDSIENDKQFMHAKEYADNETNQKIQQIYDDLYTYINNMLTEQKNKEQEYCSQVQSQYELFIQNTNEKCRAKWEVNSQKVEEEYINAKNAYDSGQYQLAYTLFKVIKGYKDSNVLCEDAKNRYDSEHQYEINRKKEQEKREAEEIERQRQIYNEQQFQERLRKEKKRKESIIIKVLIIILLIAVMVLLANWLSPDDEDENSSMIEQSYACSLVENEHYIDN